MTANRCDELKAVSSAAQIVAGVLTTLSGLARQSADTGDEEALIAFVKAAELQNVRNLMNDILEICGA